MHFPLAFIEGIGGPELMMIMFIVLLLFGADKLPGLAKGLGKSVREFKKAASGIENEVRRAMEEDEPEETVPKKFPAYPPAPAAAVPPVALAKPVTPIIPAEPAKDTPPALPPPPPAG